MATTKVVFEIDIKGSKQVFEIQKQIKELKKQLAATDDPTIADQLLKDLGRLQVDLGKAKQSAKLAQKEFEANDKTIGSYKQLSAQLFVARERFKQLAASGKASAKELDGAEKEANRLQNRLKQIDQATGNFSRNVGNYAGSLKGLFGGLRSTIRNTRLLQSAFSFLPGIGDAVQILTEKFLEWANAESDARKAARELEEATESSTKSLAGEAVQLDLNTAILQDSTKSQQERQAALEELQALYPAYFENIDLERSSQEDIAAAYRQATSAINLKIKAQALESLAVEKFTELSRKQRDLAKTNAAIDAQDEQSKLARAKAAELLGVSEEKLLEIGSEERKKRQQDLAKLESQYQELLNELKDVEVQTQSNSKTDEQAAKRLEETGKAAERAAAMRKKAAEESKKADEARAKAIEKLASETIKFEEKQAQALADLQKQIVQTTINNIEDEGKKTLAQEAFNFAEQKAQREANFEELIARIEAQETKLLEVFGENSQEVIAFRAETNEQLAALEAAFYALSEQEAIEHEQRLKEIEEKGETERAQAEQEARAAQIEQLTQNYNLIELKLREQLANQEITTKQFEQERLDNQRAFLQSQIDLLDASDKDYILKRQELITQLAELDSKQTSNAIAAEEERNNEKLKKLTKFLQESKRITGAIFDAIDASTQAQLNKFDEQLAARQNVVSDLESKIQDATGLEREFLEQQKEAAVQQAEQLAKEREQIEKRAAKERKANAIIQAIINTALGVTQALASLPPPASFITAGITGAIGAVEVATIAAQPLATGGIVGKNINGSPVKRSNGDDTLTTLKRGEVVLNKKQQSALGGNKTFASIGVPGFAAGGLVGSSITPTLPSNLAGAEINQSLEIIKAMDNKTDAINNRIDRLEVNYTPNTQDAIDRDQSDIKEIRNRSTL